MTKVKINDLVSKENITADSLEKRGKVIRIYGERQKASVMWFLDCGGIMCQPEDISTLILLPGDNP